MKPNHKHVVYVVIAAAICLVPSLGMLVHSGGVSADSDNVAAPQLFDKDGNFNVDIMSDAGDWFESNIAFRDELVSANSALQEHLFGTSSQSGDGGVVVGTDGWLYYADSLDDYQGLDQLNDRQLFDVAHSLKLMQDYVESRGGNFAFTIAPNKATLYAQHMPYYYANGVVTDEGNYERIVSVLEQEGVNYVDLYSTLSSEDGVLYHERDSHWTSKGASIAADKLMDSLGQEHRDWSKESSHLQNDYTGDLDQMLYPAFTSVLNEVHYDNAPQYSYVKEVESNFAAKINTTSKASGNLICYRDSFGSALLPFLAEGYGTAYFSRSTPYPVATDLDSTGADTVIIERAERFISEMASNVPLVPAAQASKADWSDAEAVQVRLVKQSASGSDYVKVTGVISGADVADGALIYIESGNGTVYEASPCVIDDAEGFQALLPADETADTYMVYVK